MTDVPGGLDEPEALQPEPGTLALASPEDDWSREDWERAAAAVLRKARRLTPEDADEAVWDALTTTTYDGVRIPPLGTEAQPVLVRPERAGDWDIRPVASLGPEQEVNREILDDLEGGATSVLVEATEDTDLAAVLDGVDLELAPVVLRAAGPTSDREAVARAFLALTEGRALHPLTNLGLDPADEEGLRSGAELATGAGVLGFVVDGEAVHRRSASDVQELGWCLFTAASYLRRLEEQTVPVEDAARLVEFRIAVTDVQLLSIAKLRAARALWARMLELCGASDVPMRLHAVTSAPMTTRFDPWVNMVRGTVAAFAAGVGGADAVTVLPFDGSLGRPDAMGRRIARNVSSLLLAESHVAAVEDPAGGSYAVEDLTLQLIGTAWAELGMIETEGPAAFEERVADVRRRRRADVARRVLPITGLSEFPHLDETLPPRTPYDGRSLDADVERYGHDYEALRADPPSSRVFLATLGPVAQHTARAGFATNLLASGGVGVDVAGATTGVDDLVAAYAGQGVVCLAGAEPAYVEWGSEAVHALRAQGARRVIVAGAPSPATADLFAAADDACASGLDAIDFLARTREALS